MSSKAGAKRRQSMNNKKNKQQLQQKHPAAGDGSSSAAPSRLNLHLDLGQSWWEVKSGGIDEGDEYLQKLLERKAAAAAAVAAAVDADQEAETKKAQKKKKKSKKNNKAAEATQDSVVSLTFEEKEAMRRAAAANFLSQVKYFHKKNNGDSDAAWLKTMMRKGTISDRVAAITLAVQQVRYVFVDTGVKDAYRASTCFEVELPACCACVGTCVQLERSGPACGDGHKKQSARAAIGN